MSDDKLWVANSPAILQIIMLRQFRSSCEKVLSDGLAVSSSCEALHIICDSYIAESLKERERVCRSSNIASG